MKKISIVPIFVLFTLIILSSSYAADLLFVHNGDGVTLKRSGEDLIEFSVYSISDKSRIDYTCAGAGGTKTLIFKNTEGWKTVACSGGMVTISVRETGGAPKGDIPGDSDVVIRYDEGAGIKKSNEKHVDTGLIGKKCNLCGKTLTW